VHGNGNVDGYDRTSTRTRTCPRPSAVIVIVSGTVYASSFGAVALRGSRDALAGLYGADGSDSLRSAGLVDTLVSAVGDSIGEKL